MNKFMFFLENKLAPFGEKVGNQRHLKALREGIMMAMPLIMIGSIFVLIASFPVAGWPEWLAAHWQMDVLLNKTVNTTFGLVGLLTSFGVAYRLAESYKVDGPSAGVISLASFLLVTPNLFSAENAAGIPFSYLGGKGLFAAIVVAMIVGEIYRIFIQKDIIIKMPGNVPEVVGRSFSAIIPGTVIIVFFMIVYKVLEVTGIGNLHNLLAVVLGKPLGLIGGTLGGTFVAVLLNSIFWFCGVNGGQVVGAVMNPVWLQAADVNRLASLAGEQIQNIITAPFIDLFVYIGGGGATIGLALCLMFFSKSKEYKTLGKISGIPALFNINTAILFSFPTVLNPIMLVPFILAPICNAVITYVAMKAGLVALTTGITLPWTTPPIIGGFLATGGHISGAVLQLILVIVSFVIYYPFFKAADKKNIEAANKIGQK